MNIVLIGAGNVSSHLGPLLKKKKHKIVQVWSRSKSNAKKLSDALSSEFTTNIASIYPDADAYLLSVRDESIEKIANELPFIPELIIHTSGSIPMNVFPERITNFGVLYPLQTFSKRSNTPSEIPFCIQGNNKKSFMSIEKIASTISNKIYLLTSEERRNVHLAAVMVNNFSNYLFSVAEKYLTANKLPFDMLRPLILETAMKVQDASPRETQTGPARRGDSITLKNHLQLLKDFPDIRKIYKLLNESIEKDFGPRL